MEPAKIFFFIGDQREGKKSQAFFTRHSDTLPIYYMSSRVNLAKFVKNIFKDFF